MPLQGANPAVVKMNQTACQIEIADLRAMVLPALTTQLPDTDHDAEGALYIAMVGRFHNRFSQSWRRPQLGPSPG